MPTLESRTTAQPEAKEQKEDPNVQMLNLEDIEQIRQEGLPGGRKSAALKELDRLKLPLTGGALIIVEGGYVRFLLYVDTDPKTVRDRSYNSLPATLHEKPAWAGGGTETETYEGLGKVPEKGDWRLIRKDPQKEEPNGQVTISRQPASSSVGREPTPAIFDPGSVRTPRMQRGFRY